MCWTTIDIGIRTEPKTYGHVERVYWLETNVGVL